VIDDGRGLVDKVYGGRQPLLCASPPDRFCTSLYVFILTSLRGNRIFCQGAFVELLFHQDECHRVRVDLFEALLEEDLVDGAVGDIGFTAGEYLETRVFFISLGGTLID